MGDSGASAIHGSASGPTRSEILHTCVYYSSWSITSLMTRHEVLNPNGGGQRVFTVMFTQQHSPHSAPCAERTLFMTTHTSRPSRTKRYHLWGLNYYYVDTLALPARHRPM